MRQPGGRVGVFVAAAARPSASRHASVHPTDALGARRYEEGRHRRDAVPWWKASTLRSGGVIAIGGAVGKPARQHPPDRRAWRARLRRGGLQRHAPTWWKGGCLRSGGRQGRRQAGTPASARPDALGARRYEEGEHEAPRFLVAYTHLLRSGGVIAIGGAVGKLAGRDNTCRPRAGGGHRTDRTLPSSSPRRRGPRGGT